MGCLKTNDCREYEELLWRDPVLLLQVMDDQQVKAPPLQGYSHWRHIKTIGIEIMDANCVFCKAKFPGY